VCLLLAAVPAKAATYLELGTAPVVAIQWEKPSFALNLGTGFTWGTAEQQEQFNDDWSYGLGRGLRSAVADHLNLGGAADYVVIVRSSNVASSTISSGAGFRAFLQYHL
jgi:hypothetical protein